MYLESEILITAMLRLIDKNIPSLPMHDGLMVQTSKAEEAQATMREASAKIAGWPLRITRKS